VVVGTNYARKEGSRKIGAGDVIVRRLRELLVATLD
jgi:hypothetical protein